MYNDLSKMYKMVVAVNQPKPTLNLLQNSSNSGYDLLTTFSIFWNNTDSNLSPFAVIQDMKLDLKAPTMVVDVLFR